MSGYPFFLRAEPTLDALKSLSSSSDLVIYCGAGVTIDRTGLSWTKLLQAILYEAGSRDRDHRERQHKAIEYILGNLRDEEQRASVITEYFTEGHPERANDFLTPILQRVLYDKYTWSEGMLLRNIARLAFVASVRLKSVTIVTTNYDVYLEEAFLDETKLLADRDATEIPGLIRRISPVLPSDEEWRPETISEPVGTDRYVELVYLHGRVPRSGKPTEGTIVLDEFSYARSLAAVTAQLRKHLEDRSVLIVGASVTDGPLIQALTLTKTVDAAKKRFAVIHPTLAVDGNDEALKFKDAGGRKKTLTQKDVDELLAYRGRQIGITQLYPISHSQTAQFVEELELSIRFRRTPTAPAGEYEDVATGINYEARLQAWADEWEKNAPTPQAAHEALVAGLAGISAILKGTKAENDALRLEIWVRIAPSSDNRTLTLFANTTGPLLAQNVLRRDEIGPDSSNASVRAFMQGRPLMQPLGDLGLESPASSRWKDFFSVPLSLLIDTEVDGQPYAASVPCGVITLAGLKEANLETRFHELPSEEIEKLKSGMTGVGLSVLRPGA